MPKPRGKTTGKKAATVLEEPKADQNAELNAGLNEELSKVDAIATEVASEEELVSSTTNPKASRGKKKTETEKPAKVVKAAVKGRGKGKVEVIDKNAEIEKATTNGDLETPEEEETKGATSGKGRATKGKRVLKVATENGDVNGDAVVAEKKPAKSRSNAKAENGVSEDQNDNKKAIKRPVSRKKKAEEKPEDVLENGDLAMEAVTNTEHVEQPVKTVRKTNKRSASDEAAAVEDEPKQPKKGRVSARNKVKEEVNEEKDDVLPKKRAKKADEKAIPETAAKPKKAANKRSKKADIENDDAEVAMENNELQADEVVENSVNPATVEPKADKKPPKKAKVTGKRKKDQIPQETEELEAQQVEVEAEAGDNDNSTANKRGGRKRAAPSAPSKSNKKVDALVADTHAELAEDDEADGSTTSKAEKRKKPAPLNATSTTYNKEDFQLGPRPAGQPDGDEPRYNLKISSWNVAGLRSWVKKEGLKFLDYEEPDIFCMQETKCTTDQLPEEVVRIPGYHPYWLCMPGGYAGVAIYSKIMPINVEYGIGHKEFDDTGRIITAEYEKFFLINVYVPNSGRKLVNLQPRMQWEKLFQEFVQRLNERKPVVICGDMNVSHQEIDLANPKSNTRSAGFTKEERDKMTELLGLGYIDTFRHLYPDRKAAYTYWTYMANARTRNVGWRLDYFIVSERFIKRVVDNCIRSQCLGSDHCPITLFLKL